MQKKNDSVKDLFKAQSEKSERDVQAALINHNLSLKPAYASKHANYATKSS